MKTIVTHNGSFHADDVFAVATLLLAMPEEKFEIIRTRDEEKIKTGDFVVDVGRVSDEATNHFDHHQMGAGSRETNKIPYAAFGLVWKKFGVMLCAKDAADKIDQGLVSFIDAGDNGIDLFEYKTEVGNYSVARVIGVFNRTEQEEGDNFQNFLDAVAIAKKIIEREIVSVSEFFLGKKEIEKAYADAIDKRLVILDQRFDKIVLGDSLIEHPDVLFVVLPDDNGGFALRAIRKERGSFESRKALPESWAGKSGEDLQKISGVSDATFCHKARFIAIAKSKEGILKLAALALQN